jgi:hypothetical protein
MHLFRPSSLVNRFSMGRNVMSTESQIQANRRNSQKSTGPRSAEGKSVVAKNAVKHGLFALETLIKGENKEDFDLFHEQILAELNPAGAVETMLAERIVSLGWRLMRIVRIQDQVFDVMIEKDEPSPMQKKINLMKPKEMRDDRRGAGPELVLGRAVISDMSNSRVLERLLMYERRIENSLHKTMDELHKRKLVRELENANKAIESAEYETIGAVQDEVTTGTEQNLKKQSQFSSAKNGITYFTKEDYEKKTNPASNENKPNQSQSGVVCGTRGTSYAGTKKHPASYNFAEVKSQSLMKEDRKQKAEDRKM